MEAYKIRIILNIFITGITAILVLLLTLWYEESTLVGVLATLLILLILCLIVVSAIWGD